MGGVTNATSAAPVVDSVTINNPHNPIARGLRGRTRCNGMYDFIDLWIDNTGRPWAIDVDVCTQKFVTDPKVHHDVRIGLIGTIQSGPSLRADGIELPKLMHPWNGSGPSAAGSQEQGGPLPAIAPTSPQAIPQALATYDGSPR
jgi:hypothetical protein